MIYTDDYQNALRARQYELAGAARKFAEERDDAMQKMQDWQYDYAQFWTHSRIPDSAFDVHITWRDIWLALWG